MQATVKDGSLAVTFGETWEEWLYDKDHPEFQQLVDEWVKKLSNASSSSKGASKGLGKLGSRGGLQ